MKNWIKILICIVLAIIIVVLGLFFPEAGAFALLVLMVAGILRFFWWVYDE